MKYVEHMKLHGKMTVEELVEEMNAAGVLGAGRIGKATHIVSEMLSDPDCTVFLTLAGALVPAGLRQILCNLIEQKQVNVLVTTGANLVHDILESLGYRHGIGTFAAEDIELKARNIGRIGDIYIQQEAFEALEKWLFETLRAIPEEKRQHLSAAELLHRLGEQIKDTNSIIAAAARHNIPIICPAFVDSIAGFHLWIYRQDEILRIDPLLDVNALMEKVYEAKKVGVIILGGGFPKHFALFANTFREGVDLAVQITMDRPEPGGLSGASLREAVSWGKIKPTGKAVTVVCDATIAFPIIVAAVLGRLKTK